MIDNLVNRGRWFFGIKTGGLVEILVPGQNRHVGGKAHAVGLVLKGRDILVGLNVGGIVRVGGQLRCQVGQQARLHEIRHVDQVERHQIGRIPSLSRCGQLGHKLGVRNGGQRDLVVM